MRCTPRLQPSTTLIDLTPLVNVVFLVLMFVFISSDVQPIHTMRIDQPSVQSYDEPSFTQLVVIMDRDHVIYVGPKKEIADAGSIAAILSAQIDLWKKEHEGCVPTVTLCIDRHVDYETFLNLFATLSSVCPKLRLAFQASDIRHIDR